MTPQESAMLHDLLAKIQQTRLTEKDPEAAAAIENSAGNNPDSLYILAQTVLVQNIALGQAKAQVDRLTQQVAQAEERAARPAKATSFLGSLLGHDDSPAPLAAPVRVQGQYAAPPYQPVQGYGPAPVQGNGAPAAGFSPFGGGGIGVGMGGPPSFLRSAATTAAGVAAGALTFEGVESLLHGFGHGGGVFGGGGTFGGGTPMEENVVNNYYGGDSGASGELHDHHAHEAAYDERPDAGAHDGMGKFDDASTDSSGADAKFEDASYSDPGSAAGGDARDDVGASDLNATGDDTAFDDANDNLGDDAADDNSGSFGGDDGGSFDGGGGDLS